MTPDPARNDRAASPWASAETRTEVNLPPVRDAAGEPRAATSPRPGSGRARVALIVGGIVVVVVLAAIGTAFAVKSGGGLAVGSPATTTPGSGADPTTAGPDPVDAGVYQAPGNLCEQADFSPLRPTFDTLDELTPHGTSTAELIVAGCDGATGNEQVNGALSFAVQVSADPTALSGVFDEDRSAAVAHGKVTAITGIGTKAYSYTEPGQVGLTVKLYDANMIMSLSWTPEKRTDAIPGGLSDTLIDTCRATLRLLRRP
jgi:hypothetical protein